MKTLELKTPYVIFLGSEKSSTYTKTGAGLVQWRPELCVAQHSLIDDGIDLGLPRMSLEEAAVAGARSLIIGTATVGGVIPEDWLTTLELATALGMDIVSGAHTRLTQIPRLVEAASMASVQLIDVREPPANLPVGTGKKRSGKRLLTVGTDCAVGKKYTALALERDMRDAGLAATFRATGQTGILIAGNGIPLDAVVADFLSGAAESLSPDNEDHHWDVIEGQGSLFHPGYAQVSLGLLIGSQADAFVVCHDANRNHIEGWPDYPLASIAEVIERTTLLGRLTNPAIRCVGISVNTSSLAADKRADYVSALSTQLGLPCVDPLIDGTGAIINNL